MNNRFLTYLLIAAGAMCSGSNVHAQIVKNMDKPYTPSKGLTNKHIALWQSHGCYYEFSTNRWEWQRARLFQTVEDKFTQGFVLPYLVPMLEKAGAYVMMPRERDTNPYEVIVDNDGKEASSPYNEKNGVYPKGLTLALANLICFYKNDQPEDDRTVVAAIQQNSIAQILANTTLWQTDLSDLTGLVTAYCNIIDTIGAKETMKWILSESTKKITSV